jgi:hypothetical protein
MQKGDHDCSHHNDQTGAPEEQEDEGDYEVVDFDGCSGAFEPSWELMHRNLRILHNGFEKAVSSALPSSLTAKFKDGQAPLELHVQASGCEYELDCVEQFEDRLFLVVKGKGTSYNGREETVGNQARPFSADVTPLERWALAKARRLLKVHTQQPSPQWILGVAHFKVSRG